ncbi:hypothetical protein IEN85_09955 [Pelagicoccus sp. NFK12]|uniref:Uncharacterized protein n=1 Tax=Pelagicoccus enzymogenes TaxID=2773457 RepID=A0A927F8R9_9BACT|nr:hypothetical protein [Pelagicoccus enzymogenes]MBD5779816.1 hypothetical protein [Pelagicoccus enzymogenes]
MNTVVRSIFGSDKTRKIEIFRRDDGSYGFEDMKFVEEGFWAPIGKYSQCFAETEEIAEKEAKDRVAWMKNEKSS